MDDYSSGGYALAAILGFYAVFFWIWLILLIGSYVLWALSLTAFFKKVGVEPWIAWVPVYNNWKLLEVGGHQGWFALLVFVPYVGGTVTAIFIFIGMYRTGLAFGKDGSFVVLGIFLPFVWAFLLGGRNEVYRPEILTQRGFPPPLAGYGAVSPHRA